MNKKGFTLVELMAVLVLIILVMMLIVPSLKNLSSSNDLKQYTTYEDMMVEYAKTYPGYKKLEYIYLKDLDINPINKKITCDGYVKIDNSNNNVSAFILCKNKDGEETYKTENYVEINVCRNTVQEEADDIW